MIQRLRTIIVYIGAIALGLLIGVGLSLDAQENAPEATVEAVTTPVVTPDAVLVVPDGTDIVTMPTGISETTVVVVLVLFAIIIGAGLWAFAYMHKTSVKALYNSTPSLVQTGVRTGLEYGLERARGTESELDDLALKGLARQLGYSVTSLSGGRLVLVPDDYVETAPPSVPGAPISTG